MRDFTWQVFTQTGDIEAYLLYKEVNRLAASDIGADSLAEEQEGNTGGEEG